MSSLTPQPGQVAAVSEPDLNNAELTALLRKFGQPRGRGRDLDAAHTAFYNCLEKKLEKQALQSTRYNADVAKVAVQEAWVKIVRSAHSYDPKLASVETWAKLITRQCAIDQLRLLYKDGKLIEEDGGDFDSFACPLPPSADALYQKQVERAAALCIEALPSGKRNYRLALELALDPDLSYADMTCRLQEQVQGDLILNTERVRGWVRHATELMRTCLDQKLGWNKEGRTT
ncbi:RNA polymerase sigma factor [Massilia glaciei]|nr:sigma factor [Massilia glaciei]